MGLTRTTDAATEPVTAAEVKEWLRIDTDDDSQDNVITILIKSARETVEEYIRRSLITQTWTYEIGAREMVDPLFLPRVPIIDIDSFTVYGEDSNGDETSTVVDSGNYQLVENQFIVERNSGWTWNRRDRAATIVYTAGYGDEASDVPAPIRSAILQQVATMYEHRESFRGNVGIPRGTFLGLEVMNALDDYRYGGL